VPEQKDYTFAIVISGLALFGLITVMREDGDFGAVKAKSRRRKRK
jgi:hypothetical protein